MPIDGSIHQLRFGGSDSAPFPDGESEGAQPNRCEADENEAFVAATYGVCVGSAGIVAGPDLLRCG